MRQGNRRERRSAAVEARKRDVPTRQKPPVLADALALERQGQLRQAFDVYLLLTSSGHGDALTRSHFGHFLVANTPASPHPDIEAALRSALDHGWIRPDLLVHSVVRYLNAKHPTAMSAILNLDPTSFLRHREANAMLQDPLLWSLLRATPAATPALDIFLARARHAALALALSGHSIDHLCPFLAALGERGPISGFALTLPALGVDLPFTEAEPSLIERLRTRVNASAAISDVALVALLACFEQVYPFATGVASHPALAGIVAAHVDRPFQLERIAAELSPATPIEAETNLVRNQYEEHPYPMWVREPFGVPIPIPEAVRKQLKRSRRFPPRSVLVAGCGTGQHVFAAADRWERAPLVAIDCSRSSRAYAIMKAREHGFDRVHFALADLLRAEDLGEKFDVVEAVGVLHHLASPAEGLRTLTRVLNPGGVIYVGLYARAARRHLDHARRQVASRPRNDAELRDYRAHALAGGVAPEIVHSPDFYSLGGCKDLIFHEREHSFDLNEVQALLADAGMSFLAIQAPARMAAVEQIPGEADWRGWHALELAEPLLFGGMYHVWARLAQ